MASLPADLLEVTAAPFASDDYFLMRGALLLLIVVGFLKAITLLDSRRVERGGALSLAAFLLSVLACLLLAPLEGVGFLPAYLLAIVAWGVVLGVTAGPAVALVKLARLGGKAHDTSSRAPACWTVALSLVLAAWLGFSTKPLEVCYGSIPIQPQPLHQESSDSPSPRSIASRPPASAPEQTRQANRVVSASGQSDSGDAGIVLANHNETAAAPTETPKPKPKRKRGRSRRTASLPKYQFPDLNFAYTPRNRAWRRTELPSTSAQPEIRLALERLFPTTTFIASALPLEVRVSNHDLASIVMQSMRARSSSVQIGPTTSETVAGIEGLQFESTIRDRSETVAMQTWVGQHGGVSYRLTAFVPIASRDWLRAEFAGIVSGFELLARKDEAPGVASGPNDYPPHDFAYKFLQDDPLWIEAHPGKNIAWFNYFGIRASDDLTVGVVSLPLGKQSPDPTVLARTLLSVMDFDAESNSVSLVGHNHYQLPHAEHVLEYRAHRSVDGKDHTYSLRVIIGQDAAHLVAGWSPSQSVQAGQKLRLTLDRFQLTGEPLSEEPPQNPQLREGVALLLNELAMQEHQTGRLKAAREHFEIAFRYFPTDHALASNLLETLRGTEGAEAALAWLKSHGEKAFGAAEFARTKAELLVECERYEEALVAYNEAVRHAPLDDDLLKEMIVVAVAREEYEGSLQAIDYVLSQRNSPRILRWKATLLSKAGQHDEAIRLLTELSTRSPDDPSTAYSLAEAYLNAKEFEDCCRICQQSMQKHPEASDFLVVLGQAKLLTEDYDAARDALERCLEINPSDSDASELLRQVSALLGRGDNRRIREPIDPVPLPAVVSQACEAADPLPDSPEVKAAGLYFVHHVIGYEHNPGSPSRVTTRRRIKVVSRYGVEQVAVLADTFNPLSERFYVNELVVRDERGTEIGRGKVADYYVLDDTGSGLDTYGQTVKIPVPSVRPGCTVDLITTRESLSSNPDFGFETHFLTGSSPSSVRALFVQGDIASIRHRAFGIETQQPDSETLAWVARRPQPLATESAQREPEQYLPVVHLNDADQSWRQLALDYLEDLQPTLKPDPDVEQLAKELCANATTPAEKIEAIARHVQTSVTYHGLEFGVRGVIPHQVGRVCRTGTGDCKDHSLLTYHLLKAVGVPCYLALANTAGPVVTDLPSLDQFDHMVAVTPGMPLRQGRVAPMGVLDLTHKGFDSMLGVPTSLADKKLLVLDPEEPRLIQTEPVDSSLGWVDCQRNAEVVLEKDAFGAASLAVAETVTLGPQLSSLLRLSFEGTSDDQRRETMRQMIGDNRSVRVQEVALTGVDEVSQPMVIRCRYQVLDAFQKVAVAQPLLVGALPNHWATLYCTPEHTEQRKTPFEFSTPITLRSRTHLVVPPGLQVMPPFDKTLREDSRHFSWQATASSSGGQEIDLELILHRPAGVYPAAEYQAYEHASNQALRLSCKALTIAGASGDKQMR